MHILIFGYSSLAFGGGFERFVFELSSSLAAKGHQIGIVTSDQLPFGYKNGALSREEICHRLGDVKYNEFRFAKLFPTVSSFFQIKELVRKSDVVYTRNEIFELIPLRTFNIRSTPVVCGVHTNLIYPWSSTNARLHNRLYKGAIFRYLLRQSTAIHVLNSFDFKAIRSLVGEEYPNAFLIPNGVDTEKFVPKVMQRNDARFRILFLGSLSSQKGTDILCRAIDYLHTNGDFGDIEFTICGNGEPEMRQQVIGLTRQYRNVSYLGFVPEKRIVDLYNSHDIVVVPSRWECCPYVCLEAQSCGVPVISTRIPGPSDIIRDKMTGLLIPTESANALGNAIMFMYRLKQTGENSFEAMKLESRQNIMKNHSLEKMTRQIESMLLHICN